jgi:hypothetical protein
MPIINLNDCYKKVLPDTDWSFRFSSYSVYSLTMRLTEPVKSREKGV